jgi:hypothetical protein
MQCACAMLSSVASPAMQYFSTSFHKQYDFRKKIVELQMCVVIFSTNFVILRRNELDVIKNVYWCACEVPVVVVRF